MNTSDTERHDEAQEHPTKADDGMQMSVDQTFDADAFLNGLDAIYNAHKAKSNAEPYLLQALTDAENAGDEAGLLTVLNETMGFYRSQGRHEDNQWIIQRSIELGLKMRIEGTEAWTTTLINAATALRAAGRYDQARDIYLQALESAKRTYSPNDRRLAALHNNISMLYSETGELQRSETELNEALEILGRATTDPDTDLDMASTHTNLALVLLQEAQQSGGEAATAHGKRRGLIDEATSHAAKALDIYIKGHLEHSAHYASALAGYAQACFAAGRFRQSVESYEQALAVIDECYGNDTDYYRITAENLEQAREEQRKCEDREESPAQTKTKAKTGDAGMNEDRSQPTAHASAMSGITLAKTYWEQVGRPMIERRYPEYAGRIAVGLVGHGSECYGLDDELSQDHDFGPRFCLWLDKNDYALIGERLEADYESLPRDFMGFQPTPRTPRSQGARRREGVFEIGAFFESITGFTKAPAEDKPHEWLLMDEPTLAAATNGAIFADPLGAFSKTRQSFKFMPEDVRLSLISRRLGMMAQAGQYNLPRMLDRGDSAAAWLCIQKFATNACSLVFLINRPVTVGYMPYYKWQFAALRRLSRRTATRLKNVCWSLETLLRLSSAACFGGAAFGEGGKGATDATSQVLQTVEDICRDVVTELREQGLTDSDETFLEWQRPYVESHIKSHDPVLRSL